MRFWRPTRAPLAVACLASCLALGAVPTRAETRAEAGPEETTGGWGLSGIAERLSKLDDRLSKLEEHQEEVATFAFDLAVLRPLGLVQTAIGAALMPVAYVLTSYSETQADAFDYLVRGPADYTFGRPLGELP